MAKRKSNPYEETARLVGNAVTNARVFGENRRIVNLVASSIGRFAKEIDAEGGDGDELVDFALDQLAEGGREQAPELLVALQALAAVRG